MAHKNVWAVKKYHPHLCEKLLLHFVQGGTVAQFCHSIDMGEACFYKWCDKYSEFKATYEKAKTFKRAFHESELKKNLENPDINLGVFKYYMNLVVGVEDKANNVVVNNNQVDPEIVKSIEEWRKKYASEY